MEEERHICMVIGVMLDGILSRIIEEAEKLDEKRDAGQQHILGFWEGPSLLKELEEVLELAEKYNCAPVDRLLRKVERVRESLAKADKIDTAINALSEVVVDVYTSLIEPIREKLIGR